MAILNIKRTAAAPLQPEREIAQLWLNVGYEIDVDVIDEAGNKTTEKRFVSTPVGIALDTQKMLPTNSQNAGYRMFQESRNGLLEQLVEAGMNLAPGGSTLVNLQVQIRRIAGEPEHVDPSVNPFSKKISLISV